MNYFEEENSYVVQGLDDFTESQLQKFRSKRQQGEVGLLTIGLTTKDTCNLRCVYCFGPDKRSQETKESLSVSEYKDVIDQASELGALTAIYCSNGEPLMDPDISEILEYSHDRGMTNAVLTNATLLGNDYLSEKIHGMTGEDLTKLLYETDTSVIMSIDSLDENIYERIVGVPGAFEWAAEALERMQMNGFTDTYQDIEGREVTRLLLSSVVGKMNFHELPRLREYAHSINAQFVCKLPSLLGRANDNSEMFFVNNETTRWLRTDYIMRMSDKKETVSSDVEGRCGVWHYGITIGNDGTIRQCFSIGDIGVGNVRDKPLEELAAERQDQFIERLMDPGCVTKNSDYSLE